MSNKCILLFSFLITTSISFSQTSSYVDNLNFSPTTPEVSALGKFIETPVGFFTGVPNISIPITEISSGDVSIPIFLKYHAGGVKVEEAASWVGTSWNLSAGGSVTRVMRGSPDDGSGGFINTNQSVSDFLDIPDTPQNAYLLTDLMQQSLEGNIDYENDIYHYSFGDFSGAFFMNEDGLVIPMPHTDIKIVPVKDSYNIIVGWKITAPNGTIAFFGKSKNLNRTGYEQVKSSLALNGGRNRTEGYITEWKLMDYEDANGSSIELFYDQIHNSTCSRSGQQRYVNVNGVSENLSNGLKPIVYYQTQINSGKLSKIRTSEKEIKFVRSTAERLDMPGDYYLEAIEIIDLKSSLQFKKFSLEYQYRQSVSSGFTIPCSGVDRSYRLFLDSVQEFSGTESLPPYQFFYNNISLPDKFSFSQDFWGYFNGKGNESLIPTVNVRGNVIPGADRFTDENYMKAGNLERIIYPTGGSTNFYYEANTTSALSFANLLGERRQITLATSSNYDLDENSVHQISEFFSVTSDLMANQVFIEVDFPCDVTTRSCEIQFRITDNNGFSITITQDTNLYLPSGNYELIGTVSDDDFGNPPEFSVRIYGEELVESTGNIKVGGLRLKKIENITNGNISTEKIFLYNEFNNPQNSSGSFVGSPPIFVELDALFRTDGTTASADIITSSSFLPFTTTKGSYIGYQQVTELFGNITNNNGKKEYNFSFGANDDSGSMEFPYSPDVNLEWLRGNLLEERIFSGGGGNFSLESEKIYSYQFYRSPNQIFKRNVLSLKIGQRGSEYYMYTPYNTTSEWFKLQKVVSRMFDSNRQIDETKTFQYHENELKHVYPIIETDSLSTGESRSLKKFYVPDISNPSLAIAQLNQNFRISELVNQEVYLNKTPLISTLLNTQKIDFKIWDNNLILPEILSFSKGTGALENRIQYNKYDIKGNPIEVTKSNGPPTVYLWGYNKKYLVAEIKNASYDQIIALPGFGPGFDLFDGGLTIAQEESLRNLTNSQITTYSYSFIQGLTSITDPNGDKRTYHYDNFNRLEFVKDKDGNIIKEHKYGYNSSF